MRADSYFTIGHTHLYGGKPCQDYAAAETLPDNAAYAIVSDGCSTGRHTDVGSRLLTLSTAQAIRQHWSGTGNPTLSGTAQHIALQQRTVMANSGLMLGCVHDDLLATCLYAYYSSLGGFVHIQGDGVLAWQNTVGAIGMIRYEWNPDYPERAAPFYPAYADDDYADFIAYYGGDLSVPLLRCEQWEESNDRILVGSSDLTLGEGIQGPVFPLLSGLRLVAVFTDGVTQIEGVDWKDAVLSLLGFKAMAGEFAKRRMIRFVRDTQKAGRGPLDDLSFAVIHVPTEEKT